MKVESHLRAVSATTLSWDSVSLPSQIKMQRSMRGRSDQRCTAQVRRSRSPQGVETSHKAWKQAKVAEEVQTRARGAHGEPIPFFQLDWN